MIRLLYTSKVNKCIAFWATTNKIIRISIQFLEVIRIGQIWVIDPKIQAISGRINRGDGGADMVVIVNKCFLY